MLRLLCLVLRVEKGCMSQRNRESITAALEISKKTPLYTRRFIWILDKLGCKTFKAFVKVLSKSFYVVMYEITRFEVGD